MVVELHYFGTPQVYLIFFTHITFTWMHINQLVVIMLTSWNTYCLVMLRMDQFLDFDLDSDSDFEDSNHGGKKGSVWSTS